MRWSRETGYKSFGLAALSQGTTDEEEMQFHNRPPPLYLQATFNDNRPAPDPTLELTKPSSARFWGATAAGIFGLGLLLLMPWPQWTPQPSTSDRTSKITSDVDQPTGVGRDFGRYSAQTPGSSGRAPAPVPEPGSPPANLATASGAVLRTEQSHEATADARQQEAAEPAPNSGTAVPSAANAATAERTPQGEAAPSPTGPGESPAAAPAQPPPPASAPVIATAPPQARPAPAINGTLSRIGNPARPIRRQARWVGGGPTDADNPRGRYQGTLAVRITVQPGGRVSHCIPVRGSGNPGLDALTCRLVRERAQFAPALDEQGRPVVSQAYTTFVWGRRPRQ